MTKNRYEIPKLEIEILYDGELAPNLLINLEKRKGSKITLGAFGSLDYLRRTDDSNNLLSISKDYRSSPIGVMEELVVSKEHIEILSNIMVDRFRVYGYSIPEENSHSFPLPRKFKLYFSPNIKEYWDMSGKYSEKLKVEINKTRAAYELNRQKKLQEEKRLNEKAYWDAKNSALTLHKKQHGGLFSLLAPKFRETHCWRCKRPLFSSTHPNCSICNWMVCNCGSCGCGRL